MHYLKEVRVENFRSCKSCVLPLSRFTPMVGCNNGGKSNLIEAIKWLLRRWALQEADFNDPAKPVTVTGTIQGISEEVLDRLDPRHRGRIESLVSDETIEIRRTQATPGGGVAGVRLDIFDPAEEGGGWRENPTGIDAAISALFPEPIHIAAMEDAAEDVAKAKTSTTIGKLIAELTAPIEERHGGAISAALDGVRNLLEAEGKDRAPELLEFDQQANEILKTFFPGVRVSVHVPPPEVVELFKGGTIRVFEGQGGPGREVSSMGHGVQRSIQMALVRYLAERKGDGKQGGTTTLLLIDEPELYLHPTGIEVVRDALSFLSETAYQVVFTTHAPQMVRMDRIADTLIVRKGELDGTKPMPTVREAVQDTIADAGHQAEVLFEFQNAAQVLFADRVLLLEGKTERRLLPLICRLEGYTPPGDGSTALVSLEGSGSVPKAMAVLGAMGIPCHALVDLDFAFRTAVDIGWINRDSEPVRTCLRICEELRDQGKIELAEDGFPKNSPLGSAEEGFAHLASEPAAVHPIEELHDQLIQRRVWLWKRGSIEHHIGMDGKGKHHLGRVAAELEKKGCAEVIEDYPGFQSLLASVWG